MAGTLPRRVPPFEQIKIGDQSLPTDLVKDLKTDWNNLFDLRDFVLNWFVDNETPAGNQNGSNKTFTLKFVPMPPESLRLYQSKGGSGAGILLIFAVDYVLTGSTIQYATAPSNTDFVRAYYRRSATAPQVEGKMAASMASGATSPPTPSGGGSGGGGGGSGGGGGGILMGTSKEAIYVSAGFAVVF